MLICFLTTETFSTTIYYSNNLLVIVTSKVRQAQKVFSPPGGLEPPTFRLTAERASRLRHGGSCIIQHLDDYNFHGTLLNYKM